MMQGMGDFLSEMATMMNQNKSNVSFSAVILFFFTILEVKVETIKNVKKCTRILYKMAKLRHLIHIYSYMN